MAKPRVSKKTAAPLIEQIVEPSVVLVEEPSVEPSVVLAEEPSSESSLPKLYETQQQKEKFLDVLKTAIENMNKTHHIEFLKRIHGYEDGTVKINENRNGVYINLSYLPDPLIRELYDLVHYTKQQETLLNIDEASKDQLKRDFFVQDLPKQTLF